jgi:hypothetical protein
MNLYSPPGHSEQVSAVVGNVEGAVTVSVKCMTLDTVLSEQKSTFPNVGLIKIDVEGYELFVLKGAKNTMSQNMPDVFYEFNPPMLKTAQCGPKDFSDFFGGIGSYKQEVLENDGTWSSFPPSASRSDHVNVYCHLSQSGS